MAKSYAQERFEQYARSQLSKPKSPRARAERWSDILHTLQNDNYPQGTDTPCIFSHKILGCGCTPTEPVMLVELERIATCGVTMKGRCDARLSVPVCRTCRLLFFAEWRRYKCKTSWIQQAANVERLAPTTIRKHYSAQVNIMHDVLDQRIHTAEEYIRSYLPRREVLEIYLGKECSLMPGYEVVYVDWSQARGTSGGICSIIVSPVE